MSRSTIILTFVFTLQLSLQAQPRWKVAADGGVTWDVQPGDVHQDHIEMSGRRVSDIVTYGVRDDGSLILTHRIAFPSLRTLPNDKSGTLSYVFADAATPRVFINAALAAKEVVTRIHHRGLMTIDSILGNQGDIALTRTIFPSAESAAVIQKYVFTNRSPKAITLEVEDTQKIIRTHAGRGVTGEYLISSQVLEPHIRCVAPGKSATFTLVFSAREAAAAPLRIHLDKEEGDRTERVNGFLAALQLETPDEVLNTAFALAKIRAAESIYHTKGGLMHGSGGGGYATIWANDQIEYANPFFPFLGDGAANEAAINELRLFARYVNPDYKPLPNAVVAEGTGRWDGPGDRGDSAMIAYGAARFALAYGDRQTGEELWKLITWCLEYCRRRLNPGGVVDSESDELEGRFPSGKANLATSSLYYDALNSAVMLGRELGRKDAELSRYVEQANRIRSAIESCFGARIQDFDAYRYYDGNEKLRAWIAVPLTVGIYDRKVGTIDALFSPALWTDDGIVSQAGDKVFFDRSTLYALRGAFAAGETERALDFLQRYSNRRLLGDHVPYPIEWGPQGTQPHLAAESALYCRVFTEGLFGIRPTGFRSFEITPTLPKAWSGMQLKNIHAFGSAFDLVVNRSGDKLRLATVEGQRRTSHVFDTGETISIRVE